MPDARSESNSESNKKFNGYFNPLLKEKRPQIHKKYINNVYKKFNCASNDKMIIFFFCKSVEHYLIKG
jgi:hemerythrin superfamily protein